MRRIASGTTDQYVYFDCGQVGLSSFTVYRTRNGATPVAMTSPTVSELDSVNMPGVYALLLDEGMSLDAGNVTEQMVFWVTHAGMDPQYIEVELFDPGAYGVNVAKINGFTVLGAGTSANKWRGS